MPQTEINTFKNYDTVEIWEVTDTKPLHICINDTLDLVIVKKNDNYTIKALQHSIGDIVTGQIDYNTYTKLLKLEE